MSRILLILVSLVLLLVLGTTLLVPLLLDKDKVLEYAITTLQKETGAILTVNGDTALSLFPTLGISLSDAAVTLPEEQQPDLHLRSLDIGLQVLPLLSGKLELDTLKLDGLVIRTEMQNEAAAGGSDQSDIAASATTAVAVPLALNVKRLIITDARLEQVQGSATTTVLQLVKLEASDLNLQQNPVPIALELNRPGEPAVELGLVGQLRFDQQTQLITLEEVTTKIRGATEQPVKLLTNGTIDLADQVADLQLALELGDTRGNGTLRYAANESPVIDANLQFNLFDPALVLLAGPQSSTTSGEVAAAANGDEPLPLETLRLIDTRAVLDIETARFDKHTVNNLHVELRAAGGLIELSRLTGNVHGGTLLANATLDGRTDIAVLETSGNLSRADIATALAALESNPILTGTATVNWQLNSRGRTQNEMTTALNGPVKLTTEDIVLQGTSVEKLLCQAVALTNQEQLTTPFEENTQFETLSATIHIADGQAVLNPLQAALAHITLTGNGSFDLLEQNFDTTFKARLLPELEQLDHACRVSKRLTAIDWPVHCKAQLEDKPATWCRVDSTQILQDLAVNEGKEKLKKKAGKFFNKLFNKDD